MEAEATQHGTSLEDATNRLMEKWSDEQEPAPPVPEPEKAETQAAEVEGDEPETKEPEKEATQEPEDEAEEASFQTINELAEALDVSPEDFMATLKATVKVDGQESEVTLAEAFKGYQREADYTRKTQEVSESRRLIEKQQEQIEQANQLWNQRMSDAVATIDVATNAVLADYQGVDWERLKIEDPTQYVIRQQEYAQRQQQLEYQKAQVVQQAKAAQDQQMQEMIPREQSALIASIPEWSDPDKFEAGRSELANYLLNAGYKQNDIDGLIDHKAVVLARKAMLYDKATSTPEPTAEKKVVRKVTKVMKPGARKQATTVKRESLDKARQRLKRTGSMDDMAAVLLERWS